MGNKRFLSAAIYEDIREERGVNWKEKERQDVLGPVCWRVSSLIDIGGRVSKQV